MTFVFQNRAILADQGLYLAQSWEAGEVTAPYGATTACVRHQQAVTSCAGNLLDDPDFSVIYTVNISSSAVPSTLDLLGDRQVIAAAASDLLLHVCTDRSCAGCCLPTLSTMCRRSTSPQLARCMLRSLLVTYAAMQPLVCWL